VTVAIDFANHRWDGKILPYIPDPDAPISSKLSFFDDVARDIDPVTYEVLRFSLWSANEDHGTTIEKLSGSPITLYTNDFNPVILTASGEIVFFGPYVQWFGGMMDMAAKFLMEHYADNPGIRPGDMFLTNDPWIGTTHQQDVAVMCPVFWEGELLCWVGNIAHQYDVGGTVPGSFVPGARDVFDEATPLAPIKIVEGGVLRQDVEELYIRHGRAPEILRIDLHAQIAGNTAAANRILEMARRYGPGVVAGAMEQIIDDGERAFAARLAQIPDGRWRESGYLEAAREGDREVYRMEMLLEKRDGRLRFSCEGTAAQAGILNTTYAAWRGGISTVLAATLAHEQIYALGGALRLCDFVPNPGTISCATYPASVCCAGSIGGYTAILLGNNCIGKMLDCAPELRELIVCNEACSQYSLVAVSGIDQRGEPFGTAILDAMIGGLGAFASRDGVDTGGLYFIPKGRAANVEENEHHFPLLYLYRRELADSGGAGKHRGGNSAEMAFIPHATDRILQTTATSGCAVPTGLGLAGGHPSCTNDYVLIHGTDVREQLAAGHVPLTSVELSGAAERVASKRTSFEQGVADVYVTHWTAGAGYGDPLTRDPGAVATDVAIGNVSHESAAAVYGVALDGSGAVDGPGTVERRERLRDERLDRAAAPERTLSADDAAPEQAPRRAISAHLAEDARGIVCCAECDSPIGPMAANYKHYCRRLDAPLSAANPLVGDPAELVDEPMTFRCYLCPSCGTQLANEVARTGDVPLHDIELAPVAVEARA
jgi:N-methylhydantoinase B